MNNIKIKYISGNRAWAFCIWHDDRTTPNLCISLDPQYYGRYKCWACGKEGKLTRKQMESLNLTKKEKRQKPISIDWNKLTKYYFDVYRPSVEGAAISNAWSVRGDNLTDFMCGWDGKAYTFPMYNSLEDIIGIQRVWLDGRKKAVYDSQLGLFIPIGLKSRIIFICEGISDTVSMKAPIGPS